MIKPSLATLMMLSLSHAAYANPQQNGPEMHGMFPGNPDYHSPNGIQLASLKLTRRNGSVITNLSLDKTLLVGTEGGNPVNANDMIGVLMTASLINQDGSLTPPVSLQINAVQQKDSGANADVHLYQVQYKDSTETWQDLCHDPIDGSNWAIPVAGQWETRVGFDLFNNEKCFTHCAKSPGEGGAVECTTTCGPVGPTWSGGMKVPNTDTTAFTFGCRDVGAVAKCVDVGYKPWNGMSDLHQACVRMMRADYCGDGQPHTRDGTVIDVMDYLSIQKPLATDACALTTDSRNAPWGAEAEWSPAGAVCVSHPRFDDDPTGTGTVANYIQQNCGQLHSSPAVPVCNNDWQTIMMGSVANGTYTPNPHFTTYVNGRPIAMLQNFASSITVPASACPVPLQTN